MSSINTKNYWDCSTVGRAAGAATSVFASPVAAIVTAVACKCFGTSDTVHKAATITAFVVTNAVLMKGGEKAGEFVGKTLFG